MEKILILFSVIIFITGAGFAQTEWDFGKKTISAAQSASLEKEINSRLLAESWKNQCEFKTSSDELISGCNAKIKNLANAVIDARKRLDAAGVKNYIFEVSGHTEITPNREFDKNLSQKRAQRVVNELISIGGIPQKNLKSIGMGSERPLIKPDNTPAKQAKNRRYEIQVRL